MAADRFGEIKRLYGDVCALAEPERSARLHAQCDDPELIAEVEALLAHDTPRVSRFARPVLQLMASLGGEVLQPGDRLGAWKLVRPLASGGMGTVYLASRSDGLFEQTTAIKVLRGIASGEALAYLAQERQILAHLAHPHIARLLDGGTTPAGQPYLVMEYIEGRGIDDYCRAEGVSTTQLLRLFLQVCAAVGHAHQMLIVHCDLKPSNILVTAEGRPILLDFGVAQLVGAATGSGQGPSARGYTPRYASPEQRERGVLGTATDVFSLGMMLAELLGSNVSASSSDIVVADIRDHDLRAIIGRATAPQADQRYLSVDALAQDLQRYLAHQPVLARPASGLYRARKLIQRRWPLMLAAAAFVLMLAGFTLRVVSERDRAQSAERSAIAERDRARQADASSRQISEFLVSVFEGSHPDAGTGNIPAATLVDQAVQRIESDLASEPMAQSMMYATLARVQRAMGDSERSRQSYQRAIGIERVQARPLHEAALLHDLAALELSALSGADAERDSRAALALRQLHAADQPALIAQSLVQLGGILSVSGRQQESRTLLEQALAIQRALDPTSLATADAHDELGSLELQAGRNEQAISQYEQSLALRAARGDNGEDAYISTQASLAKALAAVRRFDEAESILRTHLNASRMSAEGDSDELAWQIAELARVMVAAGKSRAALPFYVEALEIGARKIGKRSLAYAVLLNNSATAFERSGDLGSADAQYRNAIDVMSTLEIGSGATLARLRANHGRLLLQLGLADQARSVLRVASAKLAAAESGDNAATYAAQIDLAEAELASGAPGKAGELLARLDRQMSGQPPRLRAAALRVRGLLEAAQGDRAAALGHLAQAEQLMHQEFGGADARSWLIQLDRALLLSRGDAASVHSARELAAQLQQRLSPLLVPEAPVLQRLVLLQSTGSDR